MRNRRIGLLDIGLDASFDASMGFVQAIISNINAGWYKPVVDVDFVRSRDLRTVMSAFTSSCDVLHVMAHGDHQITPTFSSDDGKLEIPLKSLGVYCADNGFGIGAAAILADGCKTGIGAWQRAVRDCLQGPVTYIGTSALINWHDSTVFCSAFYGALFRNKGRGITPADQAVDAAERANESFFILTGRKSPFKITMLTPSRHAKRMGLA